MKKKTNFVIVLLMLVVITFAVPFSFSSVQAQNFEADSVTVSEDSTTVTLHFSFEINEITDSNINEYLRVTKDSCSILEKQSQEAEASTREFINQFDELDQKFIEIEEKEKKLEEKKIVFLRKKRIEKAKKETEKIFLQIKAINKSIQYSSKNTLELKDIYISKLVVQNIILYVLTGDKTNSLRMLNELKARNVNLEDIKICEELVSRL